MRIFLVVLSCCLLVVILEPTASPVTADSQSTLAQEVPDDPPAPIAAYENVAARSAGMRVEFGVYESIQVNTDSLGQNIVGDAANEPSIAVHPHNPNNMVIGWRQFYSVTSNFRQAGRAYTFDSGQTWTSPCTSPCPGVLQRGVWRSDPVLDAGPDGTFYYQSLNSDFLVDVFLSTNGGVSWFGPVPEHGGDKNWMAVDRTGGQGNGNIYAIWQFFVSCCGSRVFTRSTNGAASFESPVEASLSPTFGTLAVGPEGELYAAGVEGFNFGQFVAAKSTNARDPSSTPAFTAERVDLGGRMLFQAGQSPNPAGIAGQANVAVDHSTGLTHGNVYLLASVAPTTGGDPMDLHLSRSTDGGATWSAPVRVNDDPSSSNWQWFGAHSVAPNGRIDVIWNDTRNTGQANLSQLFYAYSYDAGDTWSLNVPVSPVFDSSLGRPQQDKIGDYYTIVSDALGANVAYAATFNGEQDVYYVRLFPDCNGNGQSDVTDIGLGSSTDCDFNQVPDECSPSCNCVDDCIPSCIGAGIVPDGRFVPGAPLTVTTTPTGDLSLAWGEASCQCGSPDYAVYEGTLGDFTSHSPRLCGTGGLRSALLTPAAGNTYYLVVPIFNALFEGSYGYDSYGVERTPGWYTCFPRRVRYCGLP